MDKAITKSIEWQKANNPMAIGGDAFADMVDSFNVNPAYVAGYKEAEKDTIERMVEWLKVHAKDYIVNMTGSYPDAPFDAIIGEECWDELIKQLKEEEK